MKKICWNSALLIIIIITLLPFGSIATASGESSEITATIDSRPIYFDVAPQQINGRVMVPLRAIFESLGAEVGWDGSTKTITGKKDTTGVTLRLNDTMAEVSGKTVALDVAATEIEGRTFVPARFVAESFGAEVKWDDSRKQVIITTGAAAPEGHYYFVYNSKKVTTQDMASIKLFANKFKQTYNVLLDASQYRTATELYDALKAEQKKLGGNVAGIQIFGVADDVPTFTYVHKLIAQPNQNWNGLENDTEGKYDTDYFYSTFKNDSKYLSSEINIYSVFQEEKGKRIPLSFVPEWPISRLPLTKGEIAGYIERYDDYRKQIEGKSVPTVTIAAPAPNHMQDGYKQDDVALFMNLLKSDLGLFKNFEYRSYYNDLLANLKKENKTGIMDLMIGADGTNDELFASDGKAFFNRKNIKDLNDNYYTAFLWRSSSSKGLNENNMVHDGLANGKMINAISRTVDLSYRYLEIYVWTMVEENSQGQWFDYVALTEDEKVMRDNNPYYFVYLYYDGLEKGKSRLQSFHDAKVECVNNALKQIDKPSFTITLEMALSLHYLGLADYE